MVDGGETFHCECGAELAGGVALLEPVEYPEARELYEDVALGATATASCPQCGLPNPHQELAAVLMFHPEQRFFIQLHASADDATVAETRRLLSDDRLSAWTIDITRDPAEFRSTALGAVLGLIEPAPFSELRPAHDRDFAYHAALLTATRAGLLRPEPPQDSLSDEEVAETLLEARRTQIAYSFIEAFTGADVAAFDPIEEVAELFPPECFEAKVIPPLHAWIEARAAEDQDVAALRAALAAAARHGGVARPGGIELARDLVRRALSGTTFQQEPETWAPLLTAGDVYRAIGIEAPPRSQPEFERVLELAQTLGHGDGVAEMVLQLIHPAGLEEDRVDDFVEAVLSAAEKHEFDDAALGISLSQIARLDDLEAAVRATLALVDRLVDERPIAVAAVVREAAARLKNEGDGERALDLLDAVEPRFPPDALPAETRSALLNERGNALRELHRFEAALQAYRLAISTHPGDIEDAELRVGLLNEARTLRETGLLQRSLDAFAEILPHTSGRQRFECLFGMTISHQWAGDYLAAQPLIDEAFEFVSSAPVDDQVARFAATASFNARVLGLSGQVTPLDLNDAVENSEHVTAREKLLAFAAASAYALQVAPSHDELRTNTLEIARGLDPPALADSDPEMAFAWLSVARLAGDDPLALTTVDALLANDRLPLMTMRAACIGADIACATADWDEAAQLVGRAIEVAVSIAGLGSQGTSALGVVETIAEVRNLGAAISRAPADHRYDELLSQVADVQSSLLLALQLGEAGSDGEPLTEAPLQVLQWLDAGDQQVPILMRQAGSDREYQRGSPLATASAGGVGERVAGRLARSLALATEDLVDGVEQYRAFREVLVEAIDPLDIDGGQPLTAVPSAALVGIPLHHALPDLDLAYSPSLGVAASLSQRASQGIPPVAAVAEVRCTFFNDSQAITEGLAVGGEALATLCERHQGVEHHCVDGLQATAKATERLLAEADIVKLSCHGVANATAGRFALVLSDGTQLPPPIADIGSRDDLAKRYLFDWRDLTECAGRCRLVVSSACMSGSGIATKGGEQVGLARAYLASGVLSFVAPLWPVAAGPAQEFANTFIDACLAAPEQPLATTLHQTRAALPHLPQRVRDAFVLHGHAGMTFTQPSEDTDE
jgi:tetratricopeptide (TPR) repeat protein